ncbi:MAG: anti-sigma factor antagonist [Lachnospiraceae bacterium]|jgi:stage II sporulation protein AA (anti-sigma F factor antagonist)|nr:anti-sigma factor antagonist [Lachnospiraceae bacterium]
MEQNTEEFAIINNYLCIRMPREVDHHGAAGIRESADRLILDDQVKNIVFDFENTTFMDSSGIGIIIGRYRKISCFGGKVYAINTNNRIRKLLKTSGMSAIIEILEENTSNE